MMTISKTKRTMTTEAHEIRPAAESDLAAICRLSRLFLKEAEKPGDYAAEAYWRLRLVDPDSAVFVATAPKPESEAVVAYVAARVLAPSVHLAPELGLVESVVVDSHFHHAGLGHALVARCFEWFREKHVKRVHTTVAADNHKAHRFFEKMGFAPQSVQYKLLLTAP